VVRLFRWPRHWAIHRRLACVVYAALGLSATPVLAQAPPPLPGLVERLTPAETPALGPALLPPAPARQTGPGEAQRVTIGRARLRGAVALPDIRLRAEVAGLEGRMIALAEIETVRLALLGAYRAGGFPYVAVTTTLTPGVGTAPDLWFTVIEGFIAELRVEGEGIGPARRQAERFLLSLIGQQPLPHASLERALLLAGDIPGMTARGTLRPVPGEPGALMLEVQLARRATSGFVSLDNRGFTQTGAWQGLLVGQLNAFTSRGERTDITIAQSEAHGQSFLQVTEEIFLGASGLRLRAYAGLGRAAPGGPLAAIGYAGDTRVAGASLSYPLIRSRPLNLTVSTQFDAFDSVVEARPGVGESRARVSRDAVRAVRIGIDGAMQDGWFGLAPAAATSTVLLRAHRGIEALGASTGDAAPTARAGSDFGFFRVTAEASRLQPLLMPAEGWLLSAYALGAAQWSGDVLPPAEKFYLGGNRLGRGFYAGQVSGDRALAVSGELQLSTQGTLARPGRADPVVLGTQFYVFRDVGRTFENGPNAQDRRLSSWGGGVRLQFDEHLQLDLEAVRRMTRTPEGAGVRQIDADALFVRMLLRF